MRSPVIAFSILAAAAVSPSLVAGAPTSPNPDAAHPPRQLPNSIDTSAVPLPIPLPPVPVSDSEGGSKGKGSTGSGSGVNVPISLGGLFGGSAVGSQEKRPDPSAHREAEQQLHKPSSSPIDAYTSYTKRASYTNTDGGSDGGNDSEGGSGGSKGKGSTGSGSGANVPISLGGLFGGSAVGSQEKRPAAYREAEHYTKRAPDSEGGSKGKGSTGSGSGANVPISIGGLFGGSAVGSQEKRPDSAAHREAEHHTKRAPDSEGGSKGKGSTGSDSGANVPISIGGLFGGSAVGSQEKRPAAHREAEHHTKRASDTNSAGGNSYTGAASDTSGGSVVSIAHGGDDPAGDAATTGVTNAGGNTGGAGGTGYSGFSYGGDGDGKGAGGNAYSGAVGTSYGGDVVSASDEGIDNTVPNVGGAGGYDQSGDAIGGDAAGNTVGGVDTSRYTTRRKRAQDSGTAGGNAYTGASSNVDGGHAINHSDNEGTVTNGAAQTGGVGGDTYSGDATGGAGDGFGPGGNAYSGATGSAVGGSVISGGGTVDNTAAITGGAGGSSQSGDAEGGDA